MRADHGRELLFFYGEVEKQREQRRKWLEREREAVERVSRGCEDQVNMFYSC